MYRLESYGAEGATVINDSFPYQSIFRADDAAAAAQIVVGLNQQVMLSELADYRFSFEVAGLTLDDGMKILTDRESQSQLFGSYTTLKNGLIPDTDWKAANGWQVGSLTEIEPIARAMAAHVRGCFRGEKTVTSAITQAVTMEQIEAIDIRAQFMASYQGAFDEVMSAAQAVA